MPIRDLQGARFGKLLVLSLDSTKKSQGSMWLVRCDCGSADKVVRGVSLTCGRTKSCGCLMGGNRLAAGEANRNHLYRSYRNGALSRGLTFELTLAQFSGITGSNCHYCDAKPEAVNDVKGKGYYGEYRSNGIDRSDNECGYTLGNSVPCCWRCNSMKSSADEGPFIAHLARIVAHRLKVEFPDHVKRMIEETPLPRSRQFGRKKKA